MGSSTTREKSERDTFGCKKKMTRVDKCWEGRVRGVWERLECEEGGVNECGGDVWQREASQVCLLLEKER